TIRSDRALISSPYASFSIGTPMITLSAPLYGRVHGVIAADLKLDTLSELVQAQRPGEHGTAMIFDSFGTLLAYPDFAQLIDVAREHSRDARLPQVSELHRGLGATVMRSWNGGDRYEGRIHSDEGQEYLFQLQKFAQGDEFGGYSLLIAKEDDFAVDVRRLQLRGVLIALIAGGCFVPAVWVFGNRMS